MPNTTRKSVYLAALPHAKLSMLIMKVLPAYLKMSAPTLFDQLEAKIFRELDRRGMTQGDPDRYAVLTGKDPMSPIGADELTDQQKDVNKVPFVADATGLSNAELAAAWFWAETMHAGLTEEPRLDPYLDAIAKDVRSDGCNRFSRCKCTYNDRDDT